MSDLSVAIRDIKVDTVEFRFDIRENHKVSLRAENQYKILSPKDKEQKTALVMSKTKLTSVDTDEIMIELKAKTYFDFSELPQDLDEVGKEICFEMAQNAINEKIDEIITIMGYPAFNINQKKKPV